MATAMQSASRTRADSPARWQAALRRALAEGIEIRQLAGCGMWIATSSNQAGTAYEVTQWECECHAGQHGDPVCKHRAALRERLGVLLLDDEPEPPTPAAPAACHNCHGHGSGYGTVEGGRMDRVTCWVRGGSGVESPTVAAA